ncbi:MAG TPA: hypothetical protein VFU05_05820 [Cyclobacteriaceae bacterium]|nr:hypothetical protein [Cyclobacteriaceae bacterium]
MTFSPPLSKFILTSHITFSVGWLGAVVVFMVLAITGLNSSNNELVRASYLAMEVSAWFVIIPLCFSSLSTGLIQALGTNWGLFKYYWVAVKLFLTVVGTILLLLHMQPISYLAGIATDGSFTTNLELGLRIDIIQKSALAVILLLTVTTISVYKPWGKIQSTSSAIKDSQPIKATPKSWNFYLLVGLIALIIIFIVVHLLGGGMGRH